MASGEKEEERLEHRRPEEERLEHRRPVQGAVVTSGAEKWESTGRGPESCVEMSGVPEMFIQREMVGLGDETNDRQPEDRIELSP